MRAAPKRSQKVIPYGKRTYYISLPLLPVLSFSLFNWVFDYVIVMERDLPSCFFVFGREFLGQFIDHPGGVLAWTGRFVCQFSHYIWAGSIAIAGCISLLALALHLVLAKRGGKFCLVGVFLPCTLLLVLHTLTLRVMMDALGLAAVCVALLGYLRLRRGMPRRLYAGLLTPAMYVGLGGYVWIFVLWVTALEWGADRPRAGLAFKVGYPLSAACMPFVAYLWLFPVSLTSAFAHYPIFVSDLPREYGVIVAILYGCLLIVPFWPPVVHRVRNLLPERLRAVANGLPARVATLAVLVLIAVFLLGSFYSPATRELADYTVLYQNEDWDGILARMREKPSGLLLVQFLGNRALYEKGRLLDDMFKYPQKWGSGGLVLQAMDLGPVPDSQRSDIVLAMYNSDLFFKMGHINMAYRQAYDQITRIGPSYRSYRRMAECHMASGRYEAARKYLSLLEKTMFHRDFARHYMAILDDANGARALFAQSRARRPTVEFHKITLAWTGFLEMVASDHKNRMALEYLVAWHLLDKGSMPIIAGELRYFKEAGYSRLPRHVQEAIFLQEVMAQQPVDKEGFTYDVDITRRIGDFDQRIAALQGRPGAASILQGEFGDTYMYFFITDRSPSYNNGNTYASVGDELLSRGMTDSAILHYRMALRYEPGDARIRGDLDKALAGAGRPKEPRVGAGRELRPTPSATGEARNSPAASTRGARSE